MGKKLAYERYYWFHGQLKAGRCPNARKLSEKFEVSVKQAQRDIEFMRDRLGAPLLYAPDKRGYELEDARYELPPVWLKEEELLALCLALRLASTLPDLKLKRSLYDLLEKFVTFRFLDSSPTLDDIKAKVSVKNVEYYRVDETTFHKIIGALFRSTPLKISYYTPHKHETTERVIQPLHLLCYMGSWHLIAYCTLKNDLRDFALSRIRIMETLTEPINLPRALPSIRDYIRMNFGLMTGEESVEVCLRFAPDVSSWISEQVWFSGQKVVADKNGSICLRFPVADFGEIRKEVLKYGAAVEVLSPSELREQIREEIGKMQRVYGMDKDGRH
jgi:predicted DNA-binding transcriptional regulator YafY